MQLHDLILRQTSMHPSQPAVTCGEITLTYEQLAQLIGELAAGLNTLGISRGDRVAVWLDKRPETVLTCFAASLAGAIFVPISPLAKLGQVNHILRDCGARTLVTSVARYTAAGYSDFRDSSLATMVLVGQEGSGKPSPQSPNLLPWSELARRASESRIVGGIDSDAAAIFYTSGSTGRPKGVVVSHRNLVTGAFSVAEYLEHSPEDVILAALPLSFDAGFSQLTTSFAVGARCVMHEYLLPGDAVAAIVRHGVTGLVGVPALWNQLCRVDWPPSDIRRLRYIANTGGALPQRTIERLRVRLPESRLYLMYGLTEAFRSTYLHPEEVERRPTSIGKAVPNAEVMVVRPDGSLCDAGEPGELVHRGPLVSLGYWNDPEGTALRFRPAPNQPRELTLPETAVWSGDTVVSDAEGYLYFLGRADDMIKCSGYRISPTEVEEVVFEVDSVTECAAFGVPHPELGQAVALACTGAGESHPLREDILSTCAVTLPGYMVPRHVVFLSELPRTQNGKVDRRLLAETHRDVFAEAEER